MRLTSGNGTNVKDFDVTFVPLPNRRVAEHYWFEHVYESREAMIPVRVNRTWLSIALNNEMTIYTVPDEHLVERILTLRNAKVRLHPNVGVSMFTSKQALIIQHVMDLIKNKEGVVGT